MKRILALTTVALLTALSLSVQGDEGKKHSCCAARGTKTAQKKDCCEGGKAHKAHKDGPCPYEKERTADAETSSAKGETKEAAKSAPADKESAQAR